MPIPIRQHDMEAVFAVTDALGFHREQVQVPLAKRDPGGVRRLPSGLVEVTVPETADSAAWAEGPMREGLAALGFEELP
jgi:hypothetical protein